MDRTEEWRVFVAVAGRRSFVDAARAMRRSPQAITRAVAALEQRLGARLLNRTTRSVSVTGEGERYLERGRRVLAELDALESSPDASAPLAGRLSITAPVLFGQLHVAPLAARVPRAAPGARSPAAAGRPRGVAGRGGHRSRRAHRRPARFVVAGAPRRPRALGRVREPRLPRARRRSADARGAGAARLHQLRRRAALSPTSGRFRARAGAGAASPCARASIVNTAQAGIDAAIAGLGIVRVLSYQVARPLAEKKLRLILETFAPPPVPIHIVQLPGVPNRLASAFVELAAEQLPSRLPALK